MTHPEQGLTGASPLDLRWLTGSWHARLGEDTVEEHWSGPGGGTLMGMFRWVRGGIVRFYELIALERDGDFVYMRVKHFDPGLVGWEERETPHHFLLVEANERGAVFREVDQPDPRWAVYRRQGPDRLHVYFTHGTEPDPDPGVFEFVRQGPA